MSQRPAVFFDLGWTLGCVPPGSTELAEFDLYADAPEALRRVQEAGMLRVVISNQKSIASFSTGRNSSARASRPQAVNSTMESRKPSRFKVDPLETRRTGR